MIKFLSIMGFLILCACTRLENSVEQVSLTCGEIAGDGKRLVQLAGWEQDSFLVVAIPADPSANLPIYSQRFTPRVTAKQCVEIDKHFVGILAVKNNTRGESFTINSSDLALAQSNSQALLNNVETKSCPSENMHTKDAITLKSQNKTLSSPALPYYSVEIIDPTGKISSDSKHQLTTKIGFVAEGTHKLTIYTLDAFSPDSKHIISSDTCQITYDIKAPTISSDIDHFPRGRETGVILLPQGNSFKFSGTDDNDLQFFACLKKRSFPSLIESCSTADFHKVNPIIQAPASGVWDIQAFMQDSAGNQSEILKTSFAVYRDKELSKLDGVETRIYEDLRQARFTEAADTFREALTAYEQFEVIEEKKFLESQLLSSTADMQLLNTAQLHKEWLGYTGVVTRSPLDQHIAIQGDGNDTLTVWDKKLNRILTRSNVAGFVWLTDGALILDRDANLYSYRPNQELALIGNIPDIDFVSDMRQRQIQIVLDPKNSRRLALHGLMGIRVYEIDRDQRLRLLWRDILMDRNSQVYFSPVSDYVAIKSAEVLLIIDLATKEIKYPKSLEAGEVCQARSFQFLLNGAILVSNNDTILEESCPSMQLITEVGGQFITENFLEKFKLSLGFQGPVHLKASSSDAKSILLAYQKEYSRAFQYFSFSTAGELKILSTGVLESEGVEPIQSIELDHLTRMMVLKKGSSFGFMTWDDSFRFHGQALWVPRYEPFSAALSNPPQLIQIGDKRISIHDLQQTFLGTRYLPSGQFLTSYLDNPSIQLMTLSPAIDTVSGHTLTFDILTRKLKLSDRYLRQIHELNLNFIPTALDTFKGEFYIAAADGKIYQYRFNLSSIIEIADFKAPVIQFEKFDEGLIAKVADLDGKNYNINKILEGQPIQPVWKRVGSGSFFSTEDRRFYHVNFGNRYVFKAPGFEKIFSSNNGMTKQTLFDRKTGDLYLLTDTQIIKYSKGSNYAEPGLRLSGGESIHASSIGLLKLANKRLSFFQESTESFEVLLEDVEQVRSIDETYILVESKNGKVFVFNYQEEKIAFYLQALTSGLKGIQCYPLGSSFLLARELTSWITRVDRITLDLKDVLPMRQ